MPMSRRSRTLVSLIAALAAVLALLAPMTVTAEDPPITLQQLDGTETTLEAALGTGPTMVVFWATWCHYCQLEIPRLKEAQARYGDRLRVVAIDPGIRDSLDRVRAYVKRFELTYPVYFDAAQRTRVRYELAGTPTILLLDAQGHETARTDRVDFKAIDALLAAKD
jgi:thiol-disulfide isomerase/thioredoxin